MMETFPVLYRDVIRTMSKKVTIEDVAKHAGVGIATVSRAINNSGGISPKTKAKVMAAIEELGFVPNSIAQSLKFRQTQQIALAVPDIRNALVPEIAYAVEKAAKHYGYRVVQINTLGSEKAELDLFREVKKLYVDGLIMVPLAYPDELIEMINKSPIPVSLINYGKKLNPGVQADIVSMATQEGKLVMEHLLSIGRTRIAYAGAPKEIVPERYMAYEEAVSSVDRSLIYFGDDLSLQTGVRAADYFVSLSRMPDAVYAENDMIAIGLINRLKELGIRVPEDIAVVGIGNIVWGQIVLPRLTTVSILSAESAKVATELLLNRILEQRSGGYERVEFEPRLIIRESSVVMKHTRV